MNYKILILSFVLITLTSTGVVLAAISVNPANISCPNAKREYAAASVITKKPSVQSGYSMGHHALTLPNAKREKF